MKTPIEQACDILWASVRESRKLTPRAQAQAAYCAGGPSVDTLERMIIADRAANAQETASTEAQGPPPDRR